MGSGIFLGVDHEPFGAAIKNPSSIREEKMKTLIRGDWILPITQEPIQDGALVIEGTSIVDIGKAEALIQRHPDARVVDRRPALVMPGLVNTHTHAAMIAFRGLADDLPLMTWLEKYIWPAEGQFVTEDFIRKAFPAALIEMIRSGTTTFADMYFFQNVAGEIVREIGMRAVLGEGIIDFPTPAASAPEEQLRRSEALIRQFQGDPLITPAVAPHAPYTCSPELLRKTRKLADHYGVLILTHIAETRAEVETIRERYGTTPVRHLEQLGFLDERVVGAHSVWVDDEEKDIYRKRDVAVAHCPESNLKLASGIAPIPDYIERGIRVGLGTDGNASNNDLDMIGEMRTAALIQKGVRFDPTVMDARKVVEMATLGGARVLGMEDRIGSLEIGKEADVVVVRMDAIHATPHYHPYSWLVYAAKSTDVDSVWVRGNALLLEGKIQPLDEEEVKASLRRVAQEIGQAV